MVVWTSQANHILEQMADLICSKLARDAEGAHWLARFIGYNVGKASKTGMDSTRQLWEACFPNTRVLLLTTELLVGDHKGRGKLRGGFNNMATFLP